MARNYVAEKTYLDGFSIAELMPVNSVGMMSKRDHIAYAESSGEIRRRLEDFIELNSDQLETKYTNLYSSRDWSIEKTKSNIKKFGINHIVSLLNFPFDRKFTYHTDHSRGFLAYPVFSVMRHMHHSNLAILNSRITKDQPTAFVSDTIISHKSVCRYDGTYLAPLYLYQPALIRTYGPICGGRWS